MKLYQTDQTDMRAEQILAKLNELRHEAEDDKTDLEYLAIHHAFCFISFKTGEFQKYLDEVASNEEAT
ncbi:MAG: hypothetical protein PVI86_00335 [Phycisphaerae bacterium]|jgi:hypothetical protein